MRRFARSTEARTASIACGALLRDPNARRQQKEEARLILRKLCTVLKNESDKSELSVTLMMIPFDEINDEIVKGFAYDLINSTRFTLRTNGLAVLERYASRRDEEALRLLRVATTDSNEIVRKSALAKVKRLESNRSES